MLINRCPHSWEDYRFDLNMGKLMKAIKLISILVIKIFVNSSDVYEVAQFNNMLISREFRFAKIGSSCLLHIILWNKQL